MRNSVKLTMAVIVASLIALSAHAHTLLSPERVQVDRGGEFSFEVLFRIEEGDERIAFFEAIALDNVEGLDWVADGECISLVPEGTELLEPIEGELIDPRRPGSARFRMVTCGVTGSQTVFEAEIEIVPHRNRTLYWTSYTDAVSAATVGVGPAVEIVSATDANAGDAISFDPIEGKLYWHYLAQFSSFVRRSGLYGQEIADFAGGGKGGLGGIDVKVEARELIYIDPSDCSPCGQIRQRRLDGSATEILQNSLEFPRAIAVDEELERMCWGDLNFDDDSSLVVCAELDTSDMQGFTVGAEVRGIAIDPVLAKVFWTESGDNRIRRANLDGSNLQLLGGPEPVLPADLTIDPLMRMIYWSEPDSGRIGRAALDGADGEYVLTGLTSPRGLELLHGQSELRVLFSDDQLEWESVEGANRYDVMRGSLDVLRQTGGGFDVASDECAASLIAETELDSGLDPRSGEGFWWLVRAVSATGKGTYDAAALSQVAARDQPILDSGVDCP